MISEKLIIKMRPLLLLVFFPVSSVFGYSNSDEIMVERQMPLQAMAGGTIAIEMTVTVGVGIAGPIKGFYLTDEVPNDLIIETDVLKVTKNGVEVTDVVQEIDSIGVVYPDTQPYRMILEVPPDFTSENQLNGDDELVYHYEVTIPDDATAGTTYTFPGYNWVGYIVNTSENIVGYEDSQNVLEVTAAAITTSTTTDATGICPSELIYGDDSEEAERLRYFRDNILGQTPQGEEIIRLYYQLSPAIVRAMEEDEDLKRRVKELTDEFLSLIAPEPN